MRWRLPLGVIVACLLTTGVVGAVTNQTTEPVKLDVGALKPNASSETEMPQDLAVAATTTTVAGELPSKTLAPPSTTTTRPPAPKPVLPIGAEGLYALDMRAWTAKLTTAGAVSFPSVSPDGSRLAYGRGTWGGGDSQLYVSNTDGSGEQLFAGIGYPWFPTFSPSGVFLAARGMADPFDADGEHERAVLRLSSGEAVELPGGEGASGRWHPTKDRYLYAGGAQTYLWDAATGSAATIPLASDGPVAWSPDGTRVAVCAGGVVTTAKVDGSDKQTLASIGSCGECKQCSEPIDWTAAGILIRNEAGDAIRVDPATDAKTVLAQKTTSAAWSPQGEVAIATSDGDNPVVVLMNADGSNRRVIVRGPGLSKYGNPTKFADLAWSPDGNRLLVATRPPPE